jgi:hypothetical protein
VLSIRDESTAPEAAVVLRTDTAQASARWLLTALPPVGNGNGLHAEYYNGMNFDTLKFTRIDPNIDFDWGEGSPGGGITNDHYSIRWTGRIEPRYSGEYTFYMTSDNGRRLWINNQLVIDKWVNDWDIEYSGTITLTAGQQYDIKVEYFEDYGGANARLRWSSASQPKEIIPKNQLYAVAATASNARMAISSKEPLVKDDNVILYPNPSAGSIRLRFKGKQARMVIYNTSGQVVMPARMIQHDQAVNVSHLQDGLYLVQVDINGVRTTKHLLKK